MAPQVVHEIDSLRARCAAWRKGGDRIALVPTMGALHAGHLRLVTEALRLCPRVVVSIFVNPAQFGPGEDFARYPRSLEDDVAKLAAVNADLVWAPDEKVMYPEGFATKIVHSGVAIGLESDIRPHFFSGVATVCCKLFTQVAPDIAVFGEKDFQQLLVVGQMARDLNLPLAVVGIPTVREPDGLAMSSRNRYLDPGQRRAAVHIYKAIQAVAATVAAGGDGTAACREATKYLEMAGFKVDYVALRDASTLAEPAPGTKRPLRVLTAAWLGKTRLIDNMAVPED